MDQSLPTPEGNRRLLEILTDRIRRCGRITFREYMDTALYHPRYGYYSGLRPPMGRGGDYVTSPEAGPLFGMLVARQLHEMWELLSRPPAFQVVEAGPGRGLLARDILEWARRERPDFFRALHYRLVEPGASLRRWQRQALAEASLPKGKVRWSDDLGEQTNGCILSNELLDALPAHRVAVHDGRLREVYVRLESGAFAEETGEPSTPDLAAYFEHLGLLPGEGCYAEVNLAAPRWIARAAAALERGFLLTFDYGYEAAEMYAPWRRDGTLLCFYRQSASSDPYARPGRQDITTAVDFTTVIAAGARAGLTAAGFTTQAAFLQALGLPQAVAGASGSLEERVTARQTAVELTDPAGLGRIRVLAQAKGAELAPLAGFATTR